MPKLILIRGLPGSGKSTIAQCLVGFVHIEADMWHVNDAGEYDFHREQVRAAHMWCQQTTAVLLRNGKNVVVSNTFTQNSEMVPYVQMAKILNLCFEIREATGNYGSVHNVPKHVIEAMRSRWEAVKL